ncbi:MAG: redoxin domain-containing protein [Opitutales bacterium]|nr:redoxin domain-containing protein [Opitutales bacterium]
MRTVPLLLAALALGTAPQTLHAAAWSEVRISDIGGNPVHAAELADTPWTVFVFIARECPVANRSAPELNRLHREYSGRDFSLHGVYVDIDAGEEALHAHAAEYGLGFPFWRDDDRALVRFTGARVTPEAVIVDRSGKVHYRGSVDDRFGGFGQSRPAPTRRDLEEAMEALAAGDAPRAADEPGFGCPIPEVAGETR